jgi:hypothetical protein
MWQLAQGRVVRAVLWVLDEMLAWFRCKGLCCNQGGMQLNKGTDDLPPSKQPFGGRKLRHRKAG